MFSELSQKILQTEGALGLTIMGSDGISVHTELAGNSSVDMETIGSEFSFILSQVKRASDSLEQGGTDEFVVSAERLHLLIRSINEEYFVALALSPEGNVGKGRFLLRIAAPKLLEMF